MVLPAAGPPGSDALPDRHFPPLDPRRLPYNNGGAGRAQRSTAAREGQKRRGSGFAFPASDAAPPPPLPAIASPVTPQLIHRRQSRARGSRPRNLQAAIGAYYDFESPNINVPSMSFVEDVTIGEGESIPPDTQFTKTWRIQNTGTEAWPPGVCLKYVGGDQFGHVNMVMVRSLEPQEIADVSVQMCSPSTAGMYQGQWRMCTATGLYYGDVIWVILSVEVGGLLGVTQQLSSFETEFNTQPHRKVEGNFNPFASPQKNRQPDENNLKDPGGSELGTISKNTWGPAPDQIEQDQNGLSQNSVNLSPSSHSNNLSVVTYSKGFHGPYPFGQS
ncbi:protein ILRUN isoform X1 [Strix uralensis]|uniref:protein ILRUN isoform X1 n=1 Tax=Strix uralensis TaxID=36305 RepID=UPI003DA75311